MARQPSKLILGVVIGLASLVIVNSNGNRQEISISSSIAIPIEIPKPTEVPIRSVDWEVPYSVQAPSGQWGDKRFQDACEEVSVIMAVAAMKLPITNYQFQIKNGVLDKTFVEEEVVKMVEYQEKYLGSAVDTSAQDTAEILVKGYFDYQNVEVKPVESPEDIVKELVQGNIVVTPMNGQIINNPYYKQPGPERHMILVKGYDSLKKEFITNDPGMRVGAGYRYPEKVYFNGIRDYPSGDHEPILEVRKVMIVVSR